MENRTKSNDQLFSEYFDIITNTHSRASLYEAKRLLGHFKEFLGNFPPTTQLAAQFLGQYADRKPNTKARYHFTVSAFFRWYSGEGLSFKIRSPKLVAHIVTDEEVERVIECIKNKRSHKNSLERDILLIRMPIHTGLRRAEMANLRVGDLNLTGSQPFLTVKGGKGAKDRIVPLNNYIKELLTSFTKGMTDEEKILGLAAKTITLKISSWAHKAGAKKLTTHSLRHKFATDLLNKGANIKVVQELMGHESLETTQVYLSITDKGLREAVDLLSEPNNIDRISEKRQRSLNGEQYLVDIKPVITIKSIGKHTDIDRTKVLISEYHSHFEVSNEGTGPAIEVEMALFDEKQSLLEGYRVTTMGIGEKQEFSPILNRPDGKYYTMCQYMSVSSQDKDKVLSQTWFPFELSKASKEGEVYVAPGELRFEFNLPKTQKMPLFHGRP